jgi:peptidoglycan hydrolase-like protein with peptidoglycan-binding domain
MLSRGDTGDAVRALQRDLNKLGSLLLVDGEYGPGTEAAIADACAALGLPVRTNADDALTRALADAPDPCPELTAAGATFIAREEISNAELYRRHHSRPHWPGVDSGITIGIGYDLRFATPATLERDWGTVLPAAVRARLAPCLGIRGTRALRDSLADLRIPLPAAMRVYMERMLPEHCRRTRQAYPMLDSLGAARRTALVSLVFNRGALLDGDRRREMKRIRELLEAGRTDDVPAQFDAMTRLWNPATERGLIERRRREARLWRDGFAALRLA